MSQIRSYRWDDKGGSCFFDELLFYWLPRDCPYGERKEKETEDSSQNNHTNGLMKIRIMVKNLYKQFGFKALYAPGKERGMRGETWSHTNPRDHCMAANSRTLLCRDPKRKPDEPFWGDFRHTQTTPHVLFKCNNYARKSKPAIWQCFIPVRLSANIFHWVFWKNLTHKHLEK